MSKSKSYNGVDFKKLYPKKRFFKLTNKNENHNNFEYKNGINEDQNFDTIEKGLHFCEKNKIYLWIWYNGNIMYNIREVKILDDSIVFVEDDCFRTNKFFLEDKCLIIKNKHIIQLIKKKADLKLSILYEIDNILSL
jgi:hypothetical protein